jgi:hypothetical protein
MPTRYKLFIDWNAHSNTNNSRSLPCDHDRRLRLDGWLAGMFETITIGEVDGSLVLHIQQFCPQFVPRTRRPQKMELTAIQGNHVDFSAVSEAGMKSLRTATLSRLTLRRTTATKSIFL